MSVQLAPELALVVSFHGVVERIDHPDIQVNHLELAPFERLVDHIRERFTVVSLDELADALAGGAPLPDNAAVLTFDDGYRSVFEHVDPLLRRYGLPYAIFVPPGLLDAGSRVPTYVMRTALELTDAPTVRLPGSRRALRLRTADDRERAADRAAEALRSLPRIEADAVLDDLRALLSPGQWEDADRRFASEELMGWPELRRLAESGVAVGSHTRDHIVLHDRQPRDEVKSQVGSSKALLEERLGVECRHFCYPHGSPRDIGRDAIDAVRSAGYSSALMNVGGSVREGMDPVLLPRVAAVGDRPETAIRPRVLLSHAKWYVKIAAELDVDA